MGQLRRVHRPELEFLFGSERLFEFEFQPLRKVGGGSGSKDGRPQSPMPIVRRAPVGWSKKFLLGRAAHRAAKGADAAFSSLAVTFPTLGNSADRAGVRPCESA